MSDELVEVLGDFLPSRDAAEEAATRIREGRGQEFLPELLVHLTNFRSTEEEAPELWQGILNHAESLARDLGRPTGLRVAAIDYFTNILRRKAEPRAAQSDLLEHLYQQATNDALTGLANRRFFRARLRDELARAERYSVPFVEMLLDVDHFKLVNDTYGHAEGDRILCRIAESLRYSIRDSDLAARWGGEEFAILMPETDSTGARIVAERIRTHIEQQLSAEGVTVSGGIACFPEDAHSEEELFQYADRALYQAKSDGRNCVCVGAPERRVHPRTVDAHPLSLSPVGASDWQIETVTTDVSQGGVGFEHERPGWVADDVCGTIRIKERIASFKGRIAHVKPLSQEKCHLGIQFTDISPQDQQILSSITGDNKPSTP